MKARRVRRCHAMHDSAFEHLARDQCVKFLDFGIAKLLATALSEDVAYMYHFG
jgi:hypothetical protein